MGGRASKTARRLFSANRRRSVAARHIGRREIQLQQRAGSRASVGAFETPRNLSSARPRFDEFAWVEGGLL